MSPVTVEEIQRILDGAERDMFPVFSARAMWRHTLGVLRANTDIPRRTVVGGWVARMYAHYALAGVRRQLSNNPTDVSLRRVLELVHDHPHLFTREAFLAPFGYRDPIDVAFANEQFDAWAPGGGPHLDPAVVERDREELARVTERANHFATLTVAHLDREYAHPEGLTDIDRLAWDDLDRAMDHLEAVLLKYYPLIYGKSLSSATPTPVLGWERAYTVPWAPRGRGG